MNQPEGIIRLLGLQVEKAIYALNLTYNHDENIDFDPIPEILLKIIHSPENNARFNILTGCRIIGDDMPYYAEAIVRGYFEFIPSESSVDFEGDEQQFLQSGSAIVYPYLRATVSQITSYSNDEFKITLPTTNFIELFDGDDLSSFIMDSDNYLEFSG